MNVVGERQWPLKLGMAGRSLSLLSNSYGGKDKTMGCNYPIVSIIITIKSAISKSNPITRKIWMDKNF